MHVFVYGTLKPGEANFDRYCGGKTIAVRRAYIAGMLYHLPPLGYPAIVAGEGKVEGFVISFADRGVLFSLDNLEGYNPQGNQSDNEYNRQLVTAHILDDGTKVTAWAYFMTPDRIRQLGGVLIPNGWWVDFTRNAMPNRNKKYAPATQRNREPILAVLQRVLPPSGTVLEISSGTGEHATFFAPHLANLRWIPSDRSLDAIESIAAWRAELPCDRLYPPLHIDVTATPWIVEEPNNLPNYQLDLHPITAIVNINMIHIAPWEACVALMAGASRILPSGGVLYLYGPFKRGGEHTASSNAEFDASLRAQNAAWGVRDLEEVVKVAGDRHLLLQDAIEMPANNLSVVFQYSPNTLANSTH